MGSLNLKISSLGQAIASLALLSPFSSTSNQGTKIRANLLLNTSQFQSHTDKSNRITERNRFDAQDQFAAHELSTYAS